MKKQLILTLLLSFLAIAIGYSQTSQKTAATAMTVTSASYTNTASDTAIYKATSTFNSIAIQAVITKISGTVAGTAILKGSLDGINYEAIGADTLTLTNQITNTHIWTENGDKYLYYMIKVTGSGTMGASFKGWFLGRQ